LIGLFLAETSPPALFEKCPCTDFFCDQLAANAIPSDIPMSVTNVFVESMQEDFVAFRKLLHVRSKSNHRNVLTLAQRFNAFVRVEEIGSADTPRDGHVVGELVGGQDPEGDVLVAAPFDLPGGPHPQAVAVEEDAEE
jgi:hypothetical protein